MRNLLYSLRNQQATNLVPDIFVIDQSNDDSFDEVDKYCKEFNAVHVYSCLKELPWSKSLSLNAGIKMACSNFIGCVDVDDIFASNFLSIVKKEANENKLLICKVWNTSVDTDLNSFDMKEFAAIHKRGELFDVGCANGACQIVSKDWFVKWRGYNEKFTMWGAMDNELVQVAGYTGLSVQWIHNQTSILHQYHKNQSSSKEWRSFGKQQREKNANLYREICVTKRVKRNENGWGNLFISSVNDYRN